MNTKNESYDGSSELINYFGLGKFDMTEKGYQKAFWYLIKTGWEFKFAYDYDEEDVILTVYTPAHLNDYFNLTSTDYDKTFRIFGCSVINTVWQDAIKYALGTIATFYRDSLEEQKGFVSEFLIPYQKLVESEI